MAVLVTGSAGFIGAETVMRLLQRGVQVIGVDNHNDYYDPGLKEARLARFIDHANYIHKKVDISDLAQLERVFSEFSPNIVLNLAAQAGVRYSNENPLAYVESNIVGFANILEMCREYRVQHLVYASSSSVYGANELMPLSLADSTEHPLSIYAATKKSNELMAHSYSHLFGLPTTGLRFFTVYGPWGRPDMALFKFTKAILEGREINLHNFGNHRRDFTYIDDVVEGVLRVLDTPATSDNAWSGKSPHPASSSAPWRIYNIGSSRPIELVDYVRTLERALGLNAKLNSVALQPGDMKDTFADVTELVETFNYKPQTSVEDGIQAFVNWYEGYYVPKNPLM